jgi:hypothetical protein
MKIGPLDVQLHRTVRVAEGRAPANLPPSLGRIKAYPVKDFRQRCPALWEDEGVFIGLHDTEALWLSFHTSSPVALLVGAGAINALTGKKLGTKLEAENYLVTPPQPWLDGWKATDGTVYQFVATPYEKGKGLTVGEQLIGEESKTGGIGIALFESKNPIPTQKGWPDQTWGEDAYGDVGYGGHFMGGPSGSSLGAMKISASVMSNAPTRTRGMVGTAGVRKSQAFSEMGIGKGGKITQKIYPDPYGLETWKELPSQTRAIYVVHAELLAEITGEPISTPSVQEDYKGPWFGLDDSKEADVKGTDSFTGLKSVFAEETEPTK